MKWQTLGMLVISLECCVAQAAPSCTPQTTRGYWVYTCEGQLPVPAMTPTRLLGTCNTSRSGYWTCDGSINLGGVVLPQSLVGQANNQADCTGMITYANVVGGQPAGTLDIDYVILNGGGTIKGLPTNSGGVLACSLERIDIEPQGSKSAADD